VLRLVEIALFLLPFAAFVAWRVLLPKGPSTRVVAGAAAVLVLLAAALVWLSQDDTLPPGADYVPPHFEDGVIVQGHGEPR
jgi:Family of unknown function (DUF6111)